MPPRSKNNGRRSATLCSPEDASLTRGSGPGGQQQLTKKEPAGRINAGPAGHSCAPSTDTTSGAIHSYSWPVTFVARSCDLRAFPPWFGPVERGGGGTLYLQSRLPRQSLR